MRSTTNVSATVGPTQTAAVAAYQQTPINLPTQLELLTQQPSPLPSSGPRTLLASRTALSAALYHALPPAARSLESSYLSGVIQRLSEMTFNIEEEEHRVEEAEQQTTQGGQKGSVEETNISNEWLPVLSGALSVYATAIRRLQQLRSQSVNDHESNELVAALLSSTKSIEPVVEVNPIITPTVSLTKPKLPEIIIIPKLKLASPRIEGLPPQPIPLITASQVDWFDQLALGESVGPPVAAATITPRRPLTPPVLPLQALSTLDSIQRQVLQFQFDQGDGGNGADQDANLNVVQHRLSYQLPPWSFASLLSQATSRARTIQLHLQAKNREQKQVAIQAQVQAIDVSIKNVTKEFETLKLAARDLLKPQSGTARIQAAESAEIPQISSHRITPTMLAKIPEWNEETRFSAGSLCKQNGRLFTALVRNHGISPVSIKSVIRPEQSSKQEEKTSLNNSPPDVVKTIGASISSSSDISSSNTIEFTSLLFDGSQVGSVGSPVSLRLRQKSFTIEAWVYLSSDNDTSSPIDSLIRFSPYFALYHRVGSIVWEVWTKNGSSFRYVTSGPSGVLPRAQWSHITAVYNQSQSPQSGGLNLFINGVAVGGVIEGPTFVNSEEFDTALQIGASTTHGQPFEGAIATVRIWSDALTTTQITQIIRAGIPTAIDQQQLAVRISSPLLAAWNLGRSEGLVFSDESGNGIHGALRHAAEFLTGTVDLNNLDAASQIDVSSSSSVSAGTSGGRAGVPQFGLATLAFGRRIGLPAQPRSIQYHLWAGNYVLVKQDCILPSMRIWRPNEYSGTVGPIGICVMDEQNRILAEHKSPGQGLGGWLTLSFLYPLLVRANTRLFAGWTDFSQIATTFQLQPYFNTNVCQIERASVYYNNQQMQNLPNLPSGHIFTITPVLVPIPLAMLEAATHSDLTSSLTHKSVWREEILVSSMDSPNETLCGVSVGVLPLKGEFDGYMMENNRQVGVRLAILTAESIGSDGQTILDAKSTDICVMKLGGIMHKNLSGSALWSGLYHISSRTIEITVHTQVSGSFQLPLILTVSIMECSSTPIPCEGEFSTGISHRGQFDKTAIDTALVTHGATFALSVHSHELTTSLAGYQRNVVCDICRVSLRQANSYYCAHPSHPSSYDLCIACVRAAMVADEECDAAARSFGLLGAVEAARNYHWCPRSTINDPISEVVADAINRYQSKSIEVIQKLKHGEQWTVRSHPHPLVANLELGGMTTRSCDICRTSIAGARVPWFTCFHSSHTSSGGYDICYQCAIDMADGEQFSQEFVTHLTTAAHEHTNDRIASSGLLATALPTLKGHWKAKGVNKGEFAFKFLPKSHLHDGTATIVDSSVSVLPSTNEVIQKRVVDGWVIQAELVALEARDRTAAGPGAILSTPTPMVPTAAITPTAFISNTLHTDVEVISALYHTYDCTTKIAQFVGQSLGHSCSFVVSNQFIGYDPAPTTVKKLTVQLRINGGVIQTIQAMEASSWSCSWVSTRTPVVNKDVQVISALYHDYDCTDKVAQFVHQTVGNSCAFLVSNQNIGHDPAPTTAKRLTVQVRINGVVKMIQAMEGTNWACSWISSTATGDSKHGNVPPQDFTLESHTMPFVQSRLKRLSPLSVRWTGAVLSAQDAIWFYSPLPSRNYTDGSQVLYYEIKIDRLSAHDQSRAEINMGYSLACSEQIASRTPTSLPNDTITVGSRNSLIHQPRSVGAMVETQLDLVRSNSGGKTSSNHWMEGDVIGMGLDCRSKTIFVTKNGVFLCDLIQLSILVPLYPFLYFRGLCVESLALGASVGITFNFGATPFRFNLGDLLTDESGMSEIVVTNSPNTNQFRQSNVVQTVELSRQHFLQTKSLTVNSNHQTTASEISDDGLTFSTQSTGGQCPIRTILSTAALPVMQLTSNVLTPHPLQHTVRSLSVWPTANSGENRITNFSCFTQPRSHVLYYEITTTKQSGSRLRLSIGFTSFQSAVNILDRWPGQVASSFGWNSSGSISTTFNGRTLEVPYSHKWRGGQTVGVGIDLGRNVAFVTFNGVMQVPEPIEVPAATVWYAAIGLTNDHPTTFTVNFGATPFLWNRQLSTDTSVASNLSGLDGPAMKFSASIVQRPQPFNTFLRTNSLLPYCGSFLSIQNDLRHLAATSKLFHAASIHPIAWQNRTIHRYLVDEANDTGATVVTSNDKNQSQSIVPLSPSSSSRHCRSLTLVSGRKNGLPIAAGQDLGTLQRVGLFQLLTNQENIQTLECQNGLLYSLLSQARDPILPPLSSAQAENPLCSGGGLHELVGSLPVFFPINAITNDDSSNIWRVCANCACLVREVCVTNPNGMPAPLCARGKVPHVLMNESYHLKIIIRSSGTPPAIAPVSSAEKGRAAIQAITSDWRCCHRCGCLFHEHDSHNRMCAAGKLDDSVSVEQYAQPNVYYQLDHQPGTGSTDSGFRRCARCDVLVSTTEITVASANIHQDPLRLLQSSNSCSKLVSLVSQADVSQSQLVSNSIPRLVHLLRYSSWGRSSLSKLEFTGLRLVAGKTGSCDQYFNGLYASQLTKLTHFRWQGQIDAPPPPKTYQVSLASTKPGLNETAPVAAISGSMDPVKWTQHLFIGQSQRLIVEPSFLTSFSGIMAPQSQQDSALITIGSYRPIQDSTGKITNDWELIGHYSQTNVTTAAIRCGLYEGTLTQDRRTLLQQRFEFTSISPNGSIEGIVGWSQNGRPGGKAKFKGQLIGNNLSFQSYECVEGSIDFPGTYNGTCSGDAFTGTWSSSRSGSTGVFSVSFSAAQHSSEHRQTLDIPIQQRWQLLPGDVLFIQAPICNGGTAYRTQTSSHTIDRTLVLRSSTEFESPIKIIHTDATAPEKFALDSQLLSASIEFTLVESPQGLLSAGVPSAYKLLTSVGSHLECLDMTISQSPPLPLTSSSRELADQQIDHDLFVQLLRSLPHCLALKELHMRGVISLHHLPMLTSIGQCKQVQELDLHLSQGFTLPLPPITNNARNSELSSETVLFDQANVVVQPPGQASNGLLVGNKIFPTFKPDTNRLEVTSIQWYQHATTTAKPQLQLWDARTQQLLGEIDTSSMIVRPNAFNVANFPSPIVLNPAEHSLGVIGTMWYRESSHYAKTTFNEISSKFRSHPDYRLDEQVHYQNCPSTKSFPIQTFKGDMYLVAPIVKRVSVAVGTGNQDTGLVVMNPSTSSSKWDPNSPTAENWPTSISVRQHVHPLVKCVTRFGHSCDICRAGVSGNAYRCSACDFDSHAGCAKAHDSTSPTLLPLVVSQPIGPNSASSSTLVDVLSSEIRPFIQTIQETLLALFKPLPGVIESEEPEPAPDQAMIQKAAEEEARMKAELEAEKALDTANSPPTTGLVAYWLSPESLTKLNNDASQQQTSSVILADDCNSAHAPMVCDQATWSKQVLIQSDPLFGQVIRFNGHATVTTPTTSDSSNQEDQMTQDQLDILAQLDLINMKVSQIQGTEALPSGVGPQSQEEKEAMDLRDMDLVTQKLEATLKMVNQEMNPSEKPSAKAIGLGSLVVAMTNKNVKQSWSSAFLDLAKDFTISLWIYPTSRQPTVLIGHATGEIGKSISGIEDGLLTLLLDGEGQPVFRSTLIGPDLISHSAEKSLPLNSWSHLAVVNRQSSICFYIDGKLSGEPSDPIGSYMESPKKNMEAVDKYPLLIGGQINSSAPFGGRLAQIRVYSRPLTRKELTIISVKPIEGSIKAKLDRIASVKSPPLEIKKVKSIVVSSDSASTSTTLNQLSVTPVMDTRALQRLITPSIMDLILPEILCASIGSLKSLRTLNLISPHPSAVFLLAIRHLNQLTKLHHLSIPLSGITSTSLPPLLQYQCLCDGRMYSPMQLLNQLIDELPSVTTLHLHTDDAQLSAMPDMSSIASSKSLLQLHVAPANLRADFRPMTRAQVSIKNGFSWSWLTDDLRTSTSSNTSSSSLESDSLLVARSLHRHLSSVSSSLRQSSLSHLRSLFIEDAKITSAVIETGLPRLTQLRHLALHDCECSTDVTNAAWISLFVGWNQLSTLDLSTIDGVSSWPRRLLLLLPLLLPITTRVLRLRGIEGMDLVEFLELLCIKDIARPWYWEAKQEIVKATSISSTSTNVPQPLLTSTIPFSFTATPGLCELDVRGYDMSGPLIQFLPIFFTRLLRSHDVLPCLTILRMTATPETIEYDQLKRLDLNKSQLKSTQLAIRPTLTINTKPFDRTKEIE